MRYLFSDWKDIARCLKNASHRLFLFDIDGTLASIEQVPQAARVHGPLRRLLYDLSIQPRTTVGIISGRQLDDAKAMIGLQHLIYAGNHGLEICLNGARHIQPQARKQAGMLKIIYQKAEKEMASVPGALVESKGLTMSLHYRLVKKKDKPKFEKIIRDITPLIHHRNFEIRRGKKVLDVLPKASGNKGTAVKMLMKHFHNPVTVFTGDDVTDEGAFEALRADDISIRVGRKEDSKASFYLKSQREVKGLLRRLVKLS